VAVSRLLRSQLFRSGDFDPAVFAGMAAVLLTAALAASYFPARRAIRVDPVVTLRHE
jgi:ABC-type lipoprotein release transport system permease subunit